MRKRYGSLVVLLTRLKMTNTKLKYHLDIFHWLWRRTERNLLILKISILKNRSSLDKNNFGCQEGTKFLTKHLRLILRILYNWRWRVKILIKKLKLSISFHSSFLKSDFGNEFYKIWTSNEPLNLGRNLLIFVWQPTSDTK